MNARKVQLGSDVSKQTCRKSSEEERSGREAEKVEVAPGVTDCSKHETLSNRVDWTNPRTP